MHAIYRVKTTKGETWQAYASSEHNAKRAAMAAFLCPESAIVSVTIRPITASQLRYHVEQTGSCFFSRSSMRFFGDSMANYGCRIATLNGRQVYELYRRKPVKAGLKSSAYFDPWTFERVQAIQ